MKAFAYIRVSTPDQRLGVEAQESACRSYIASRYPEAEVIVASDVGVSGGTPVEDRPSLSAILHSIDKGDILVVSKRDRLARDVVISAVAERLIQSKGARIESADGVSAADTPEGALMRTLIDAFATYERAVIRARTKAALSAKKARGEKLGRPRVEVDIDRVRELRQQGLTLRQISAQTEIPISRLSRLLSE